MYLQISALEEPQVCQRNVQIRLADCFPLSGVLLQHSHLFWYFLQYVLRKYRISWLSLQDCWHQIPVTKNKTRNENYKYCKCNIQNDSHDDNFSSAFLLLFPHVQWVQLYTIMSRKVHLLWLIQAGVDVQQLRGYSATTPTGAVVQWNTCRCSSKLKNCQ